MSTKRLINLYLGLLLFGASIALMVRAGLGLGPWDVLHQGVSLRTGLPIGCVVNLTAALVLLLWLPLRQRPGLGTISNVIVVGIAAELTLMVFPEPGSLVWQIGLLVSGIVMQAIATGLYIGAGFGPGPRDGLMTGLAARGFSIRLARTWIEIGVLAVGWLLGGTIGVGTLVYAISIGPLAHYFIPRLEIKKCSLA